VFVVVLQKCKKCEKWFEEQLIVLNEQDFDTHKRNKSKQRKLEQSRKRESLGSALLP
jgi:hypothetical protein